MDIPKNIDLYFNPESPNEKGYFRAFPVDPKKPGTAVTAKKNCGDAWEKESFSNDPTSVRIIRSYSIGHQDGVEVLIHEKYLVVLHHIYFIEIAVNCPSQNGVFENVIFGRHTGSLHPIAAYGWHANRIREAEKEELEREKPAKINVTFNRIEVGKVYDTFNGKLICIAKGVAGIQLSEDKFSFEDQALFVRHNSWHYASRLTALKSITAESISESSIDDLISDICKEFSKRSWYSNDQIYGTKALLKLYPEKFGTSLSIIKSIFRID